MEHELSALYDIPHGAGLAVVTPAWMHYVYRANPGMFVQFAVNVMNVEGSYRDQDSIIREGINRLQAFFRNLGQPTTMQELGISPEDFPVMANNAINVRGPIGGLMKLDVKDVQNIYKIASMQTI